MHLSQIAKAYITHQSAIFTSGRCLINVDLKACGIQDCVCKMYSLWQPSTDILTAYGPLLNDLMKQVSGTGGFLTSRKSSGSQHPLLETLPSLTQGSYNLNQDLSWSSTVQFVRCVSTLRIGISNNYTTNNRVLLNFDMVYCFLFLFNKI